MLEMALFDFLWEFDSFFGCSFFKSSTSFFRELILFWKASFSFFFSAVACRALSDDLFLLVFQLRWAFRSVCLTFLLSLSAGFCCFFFLILRSMVVFCVPRLIILAGRMAHLFQKCFFLVDILSS